MKHNKPFLDTSHQPQVATPTTFPFGLGFSPLKLLRKEPNPGDGSVNVGAWRRTGSCCSKTPAKSLAKNLRTYECK